MRTHLNTLFVTRQGTYLSKDGETVRVRSGDETLVSVPIHNLEGVVCFGNVLCSPFLLGHCAGNGVQLSWLSKNGRFLGRLSGPASGNVLLRREQYRRSDSAKRSAAIARNIVLAKIVNSRSVIRRAIRDHGASDDLSSAARSLSKIAKETVHAGDLETIRGLEGRAAQEYFACFDALIVRDGDEFRFAGRNRRPPTDRINSLLSFLYTLLVHDVSGAVESVGLDPQVGFLHRDRPGRPSLALDLMEELRPLLADRLALSLVNRRQLQAADFEVRDGGAVVLRPDARKKVLVAYQKRKGETVTHPFLREKTTLGLVPQLQARLLARMLRGDLDGYPPYMPK